MYGEKNLPLKDSRSLHGEKNLPLKDSGQVRVSDVPEVHLPRFPKHSGRQTRNARDSLSAAARPTRNARDSLSAAARPTRDARDSLSIMPVLLAALPFLGEGRAARLCIAEGYHGESQL